MKKAICIPCGKHVDYHISKSDRVEMIQGIEIQYKEKTAYCNHCGEAVWVEEIEMENTLAPINIYNDLIKHNITNNKKKG